MKEQTTVTLTQPEVALLLQLLSQDTQFWLSQDNGPASDIAQANRRLMDILATASESRALLPREVVRV